MYKSLRMGLVLTVLTAAPGAALADTAVGMRGAAPLVCSAGIDPTIATTGHGDVDLGQLTEFCNAPEGYEVWLDYPAQLRGAVLRVDGRSIVLPAAGTVRLDRASGPARHARAMRLRGAGTTGVLSLTVRVMPGGASGLRTASN